MRFPWSKRPQPTTIMTSDFIISLDEDDEEVEVVRLDTEGEPPER